MVPVAFRAAGGMRRGNMGHLTRIANAVVQNLERGPVQTHISEVIRGEPPTWSSCWSWAPGAQRSCRLRLPSACQQVLTALTVRDPAATSVLSLHTSDISSGGPGSHVSVLLGGLWRPCQASACGTRDSPAGAVGDSGAGAQKPLAPPGSLHLMEPCLAGLSWPCALHSSDWRVSFSLRCETS